MTWWWLEVWSNFNYRITKRCNCGEVHGYCLHFCCERFSLFHAPVRHGFCSRENRRLVARTCVWEAPDHFLSVSTCSGSESGAATRELPPSPLRGGPLLQVPGLPFHHRRSAGHEPDISSGPPINRWRNGRGNERPGLPPARIRAGSAFFFPSDLPRFLWYFESCENRSPSRWLSIRATATRPSYCEGVPAARERKGMTATPTQYQLENFVQKRLTCSFAERRVHPNFRIFQNNTIYEYVTNPFWENYDTSNSIREVIDFANNSFDNNLESINFIFY